MIYISLSKDFSQYYFGSPALVLNICHSLITTTAKSVTYLLVYHEQIFTQMSKKMSTVNYT